MSDSIYFRSSTGEKAMISLSAGGYVWKIKALYANGFVRCTFAEYAFAGVPSNN